MIQLAAIGKKYFFSDVRLLSYPHCSKTDKQHWCLQMQNIFVRPPSLNSSGSKKSLQIVISEERSSTGGKTTVNWSHVAPAQHRKALFTIRLSEDTTLNKQSTATVTDGCCKSVLWGGTKLLN